MIIMYRKTYVEVDMDIIKSNIENIRKVYSDYKYYIGVVKNNAYAHGINSIQAMIDAGINYLATSSLEEALEVRKNYKSIPILILEPIDVDSIKVATKNNIAVTIDSKDIFNQLIKENVRVRFHLKIDVGMNRFGLKDKDDINYIVNNSNKTIYLEGIYSHLSAGVNPIYSNQIERFKYLTKDVDLSKIDIVHLDRSLTLEQHEKEEFVNGVRLGILMYGIANLGYIPSWKRKLFNILTFKKTIKVKPKLSLKTAFIFKTHVMKIKEVNAAEIVGYGGTYNANENIKIALLPFGFADFIFDNTSKVYIKGKYYNIISVNMDVTTVIVDDSIKSSDEVEIFGNNISIRDKAKELNINVYKLFTSVTTRVPRLYKYKKKKIEIKY